MRPICVVLALAALVTAGCSTPPCHLSGGETEGTPETWRDLFAYCQEVDWRFDEEGRPTTNAPPPAMIIAADGDTAIPFDPDGFAAEQASRGDGAARDRFLVWLDAERSIPGECVLVSGTDEGGVYVLSEHDAEARCLKRYDMAAGTVECLTPTNATRELLGPVLAYEVNHEIHEPHEKAASGNVAPEGNVNVSGTGRLLGLVWRSLDGDKCEWRDSHMSSAEADIRLRFPGARPDWICCSPAKPTEWIVRCRFPDMPPLWLLADTGAGHCRLLSRFANALTPTSRTAVRFTASDGAEITGVFTRPEGIGPFPLVVFPHGGPGALSTTDFDERVWVLCDAGFAVFQPNYRGSAGLGKRFRLDGWGTAGIRRAMLDIREGVEAIRANPDCRIAEGLPVLLGGSWGGYCAVEQLALFPDDYGGAVSFFGAFDLPALLDEALRVAGDNTTPREAERARAELRRQFGDPGSYADREALAAISPLRQLDAICRPVVLFHNREDAVIPFRQSEALFEAMTNRHMSVEFRVGDGGHGFAPTQEAAVYARLVGTLRDWTAAGKGHRSLSPSPTIPEPVPYSWLRGHYPALADVSEGKAELTDSWGPTNTTSRRLGRLRRRCCTGKSRAGFKLYPTVNRKIQNL